MTYLQNPYFLTLISSCVNVKLNITIQNPIRYRPVFGRIHTSYYLEFDFLKTTEFNKKV